MDLKFFIRTTNDRILHESIKKELGNNYTLLVDTEHKPVDSFIDQLKIISDYDAVLLEDDIILCKNFIEEITKVIDEWKDNIINFFTFPHQYFTTTFGNYPFVYNQCTYYPKGLGKKIADEMEKLRHPYNQYDTLENLALRKFGIPHLRYRPCLVQHIDKDTLIQKASCGGRRCIWFKDYLDELKIDLLEAWTEENKDRLTNLMNEKFKNF